ncbi:MAG: 50S ribosomal protein L13 [Planctomycetes bacterium]|jgi:large subunit ribosomal protein L13|nr:50S ribosomal protein L13 [Planctomycetota bacterium]MCL4730511.1 50S ribosomal protein L13 [Planctomycetota bacterium]
MTVAHSQKSWRANTGDVKQAWHLIDASGQNLGRMASKIAVLLMGKHKPTYTQNVDTGDFVVVTNVEKVVVSGRKSELKEYLSFSLYPGGQRRENFASLQQRFPEKIVMLAVRRMLPKNKIGRHMLTKLKLYKGGSHPHAAQKPQPYTITYGQKAALGK